MKYYYDMHIHTALSPCAEDDMTPQNIVNMAVLKNLHFIAVCDHNSAKNCRAVINAAQGTPLLVIPAVELTCSENVHMLCLFRTVEQAEQFDEFLQDKISLIPHSAHLWGNQILMDEHDNFLGTLQYYLPALTSISVLEVYGVVQRFGGIAVPAHIDRQMHGILGVFGTVPKQGGFKSVESRASRDKLLASYPELACYNFLCSSDAHCLGWILERNERNFLELNKLTIDNIFCKLEEIKNV